MSLADGNTTIRLQDLTPDWLRKNYLLGLKFVDECGNPYDDDFYETYLQNAVRKLEMLCDISILSLTINAEQHDYDASDYIQWGFLRTFKVPVKQIDELRGVYPTNVSAVRFPSEWIEFRADTGQINIVANGGGLGQVVIGQGGTILPMLYGGMSTLPNLWQIDYVAGMDEMNLPRPIVEAVAKMAASEILTMMSDLIRPLGVNSQSVSIDGLSQSQSYQVPAFKARLDRYDADLYGPAGKQQVLAMTNGLLKQIYDAFHPIQLESM